MDSYPLAAQELVRAVPGSGENVQREVCDGSDAEAASAARELCSVDVANISAITSATLPVNCAASLGLLTLIMSTLDYYHGIYASRRLPATDRCRRSSRGVPAVTCLSFTRIKPSSVTREQQEAVDAQGPLAGLC